MGKGLPQFLSFINARHFYSLHVPRSHSQVINSDRSPNLPTTPTLKKRSPLTLP
ncbi:hypothetical protein CKA32_003648 [Geitlerinema sp. FC II]|nr:hypothetical protein CKA32_003648 [Geitlerinema sp. FC II]